MLLPASQQGPRFNSLTMWGPLSVKLDVLPVSGWISSGYSGFLYQPKTLWPWTKPRSGDSALVQFSISKDFQKVKKKQGQNHLNLNFWIHFKNTFTYYHLLTTHYYLLCSLDVSCPQQCLGGLKNYITVLKALQVHFETCSQMVAYEIQHNSD